MVGLTAWGRLGTWNHDVLELDHAILPGELGFLAPQLGQRGQELLANIVPVQGIGDIGSEKPDLVVLDVKMPDLDGFGVLAMLRGEGNPVPVVMCSGSR